MDTPIPDNFKKVIVDFISSFIASFPEYKIGIYKALDMQEYSDVAFVNSDSGSGSGSGPGSGSCADDCDCIKHISDQNVTMLFEHCKRVYPERFFDIIYQNDLIFSPDSTVSNNVCVEFLPNTDFRMVWNLSDVTDTTKDHLWKHLQLVTFTILGSISKDAPSFGETARLFEAIDEDELRVKLEETMAGIHKLFENENSNNTPESSTANEPEHGHTKSTPGSGSGSGSGPGIPSAESIHEHLSGLLNGKIGALAKEIAEETVTELDIDISNESSVGGVFQKLIKNPSKFAGIIKKVGEKLDKKMKSGDIKESELFKEASEFMSRMKSSGGKGAGGGGMADFAQLFKAMNLNPSDLGGAASGLNGKTKINVNAMQSQLNRNMKMALAKERMHKKLDEKRAAAATATATSTATATATMTTQEMRHSVYQPPNAAKNEKTPRIPMAAPESETATPTPTTTTTTTTTTATGYEPAALNAKQSSHKKNKHKK
jgi:hypothetical protein